MKSYQMVKNNIINNSIKESLSSNENIEFIKKIIREQVIAILEDTTLRGLVAKAESRQKAEESAAILHKHKISARISPEAVFDLFNQTELPGWGIYVEPSDVRIAAKKLIPHEKGLQFDPYIRSSNRE